MTVQGVIFDLGGTLAAPVPPQDDTALDRGNAAALLAKLRQRGFQVPEEFVETLVVEREACVVRREGGVREITAAEALRPVFRRYGLPDDEESVTAAETAFFAYELTVTHALPGAAVLLRWVRDRGWRAGVLSNASSHYFVVECCRRLGLAAFLDPVVSSAQVGWMKPDSRAFAPILSAWSLPPSEVVMIGDTPSADIAGANRLGMRSILIAPPTAATWVPRPNNRPQLLWLKDLDLRTGGSEAMSKPDAVAVDLTQVRRLLEQWTVTSRR